MENDKDFDWKSLSKKELKELYYQILDTAHTNPRYKIEVMHKWNVSAIKLLYMTFESYEERRKDERKKKEITAVINNYLNKRLKEIGKEEFDKETKWLMEQAQFRNQN